MEAEHQADAETAVLTAFHIHGHSKFTAITRSMSRKRIGVVQVSLQGATSKGNLHCFTMHQPNCCIPGTLSCREHCNPNRLQRTGMVCRFQKLLRWHVMHLAGGDKWIVNIPAEGKVNAWPTSPID
jgi:hypothetical protein